MTGQNLGAEAPKMALSQLHADLAALERQADAHLANRIVNDPSIYPWVKGYAIGRLDLTAAIANKANVALFGEHGGMVFHHLMSGIYEAHTSVVEAGRGEWALRMARAALHWMFTRTDAVEIMTRAPRGNLGALTIARAVGATREFVNKHGWVVDGDPVPTAIYGLRIQDWTRTAPGLTERGAWFHRRLEDELRKLKKTEDVHEDDETHDRYVGMACEMMLAGQPMKGQIFYNRWALMAGYRPIQVMSASPLTVDIRSAMICVRGDDFWVMSCPSG
jgi:hypothetical protein